MAEASIKKELILHNPQVAINLFGVNDGNLSLFEESLNIKINAFGEKLSIIGSSESVTRAIEIINELIKINDAGIKIGQADVISAIKMSERGTLTYFSDLYKEILIRDAKGRPVRVKNFGQRQYINSIKKNDVSFGIGPAGTGKTYLAVIMAVAALKEGTVEKLILTRPSR